MTKPPRAATKSDASGKRPKRAATQGGSASSAASRPRLSSVVPTDQFLRITDEEIVEVRDATNRALPALPALPPVPESAERDPGEAPGLRLLVLESATHLQTALAAATAAGHTVVLGAAGTAGIDKLKPLLGEVDAVMIALPGGEPLLDAVLALGPRRPLVIGSITASAAAAARRATAVGADLFVGRPHDVERLAPVLFAAARLAEHRRQLAEGGAAPTGGLDGVDVDLDDALSDLEGDGEADHGGGTLQPLDALAQIAARELARSQRYGYPLALAVFALEVSPPPPPPALRGLLRARTGNALVNAVRDIDVVAELEGERFVVLLPYTDRLGGADVARRIISGVAAADPINAGGRSYPPRVVGAVVGLLGGTATAAPAFDQLLRDAIQLLDQAQVTGASLAVET